MSTAGSRMGQNRPSQEAQEHSEGFVARAIEKETAKLPSDAFLWGATVAIGGSLLLHMMDKREEAVFVGQWAPTILILGLYDQLVKVLLVPIERAKNAVPRRKQLT